MSLLDTLRKSLDSDLFAKVTDALGDDFNYDQVPRSRLNKVIEQRNAARTKLEEYQSATSSQEEDMDDFEDTPKAPTNSGSAPQKPKSATFSQADIDAAVNKANEASNKRIREMQIKYATTAKLREAKFTDPALVIDAGLIDFTKVELDDRGMVVSGLDDQIAAVAEAKPFLIDYDYRNRAPSGTGKSGGVDNFGSITSREEFLKLPTDKQLEFKTNYPDVFKGFMEGI